VWSPLEATRGRCHLHSKAPSRRLMGGGGGRRCHTTGPTCVPFPPFSPYFPLLPGPPPSLSPLPRASDLGTRCLKPGLSGSDPMVYRRRLSATRLRALSLVDRSDCGGAHRPRLGPCCPSPRHHQSCLGEVVVCRASRLGYPLSESTARCSRSDHWMEALIGWGSGGCVRCWCSVEV
jgi:hypothetical protein